MRISAPNRQTLHTFACVAAFVVGSSAHGAQTIVPEPPPQTGIARFTFPESEAALTAQVTAMFRGETQDDRTAATESIALHAWGLWTAATAYSAQTHDGQRLRVFETWTSIEDLAAVPSEVTPTKVSSPRRLVRLRIKSDRSPDIVASSEEAEPPDTDTSPIIGAVKFSPGAVEHLERQQLFRANALEALLTGGAVSIPPFPSTSVVVKPIYRVIASHDLVGGRYYLLNVWSGPPSTPQAWGPDRWPTAIWIDLKNDGMGHGEVDSVRTPDGSSRTDATTYPVDNFIHYRLSASDATAYNALRPGANASAGDIAILLAMHLSTRELARWTWQTFWWTPAPESPPSPSTAQFAGARPPQLQGAARHYALSLAYTMLAPEPPYTGGDNSAPAVYAYNPWIEARFAPADLPDSKAGVGPDGQPATNDHGVQTNCVSCHAQATYHKPAQTTAPRFTGARYVDLIDPQFVGTLQTDFVWSLPRRAQ